MRSVNLAWSGKGQCGHEGQRASVSRAVCTPGTIARNAHTLGAFPGAAGEAQGYGAATRLPGSESLRGSS